MCSPGNNLNRSCSESDLYKVNFDNLTLQDCFEKSRPFVRRRVLIVEEIIHDNSPGLLRGTGSSSCGRRAGQSIPDHLHNLQSFFSTSFVLNNASNECDTSSLSLNTQLNPNFPNPKLESGKNYMKNEDVMPMEIDILNDSLKLDDCDEYVETMDVDIDPDNFTRERINKLDSAMLKKRYASQKQVENTFPPQSIVSVMNKTKIVPITLQKKQSKHKNFLLISSLCFVLILVYILFIQGNINIMFVNSDIQLKNIQKDLVEKVHKQKTLVNIVTQSLEQREYWPSKIKVLGFIGPTGVGKTFVANIIKKHFPQGLIHELYGIQLSYKSQWEHILSTFKSCCFNLVIIDDLKREDIMDVFALIHSLPQNQYILVISIFNIQYYNGKDYTIKSNDITEIRNEFDNSGLYHELVVFQEFNIDEVKDWIEEQFKLKNIESNIQKKILDAVLGEHIVQYQGLKGLYSKVLLELEKYKQ